ncbi:MAG: DUF1572 family protein [Phycisphaerales bacterium]
MTAGRTAVEAFEQEFEAVKRGAEKAIVQLDDAQLRACLNAETNSVAVIMKHLAGNFCSRFTNFLTEDGEKPWRQRDGEFVDDFPAGAAGRAAVLARWEEGWACVRAALAPLTDADLGRTVTIRSEPHTVARALARALAHAAYHQAQMVLIARTTVGPGGWKTITIPRGQSAEYNRAKGHTPTA